MWLFGLNLIWAAVVATWAIYVFRRRRSAAWVVWASVGMAAVSVLVFAFTVWVTAA